MHLQDILVLTGVTLAHVGFIARAMIGASPVASSSIEDLPASASNSGLFLVFFVMWSLFWLFVLLEVFHKYRRRNYFIANCSWMLQFGLALLSIAMGLVTAYVIV